METLKRNWPKYYFGQPAHFMAAVLVLTLAYFLFPSESEKKTLLAWMVHLLSFASYFGTQVWVTFVAGLSMFHALPRHTFADVQSVLFPKYFLFGTILAVLDLASFVFLNGPVGTLSPRQQLELAALAIAIAMSLVNIFIAGPLIDNLVKRNKIEKEAGVNQIGHIDKKMFEGNTKYQELSKTFLRLHGISSLANLLVLACHLVHIYFLAIRLNS